MKSRSSLPIVDKRKWRHFHSKDDTDGKLWMEVTVLLLWMMSSDVVVLTAKNYDVN